VKTFERQITDAIGNLTVAVVVIGMALVAAIGLAAWGLASANDVGGRLSQSQARTCEIQERGLPAGHALAAVIGDLHFLVAQPLTAQQKRNLERYPPKVRAQLLAVYRDLNVQAFNYAWYERQQPKSRSCGF
jgi:hypothetical protein